MKYLRVLLYLLIFFALVGVMYRLALYARGLTVTSWWRMPGHNKDIGGKVDSQHLIGLGFDVLPVNEGTAGYLRSIGLTVINEGDHLHAQVL